MYSTVLVHLLLNLEEEKNNCLFLVKNFWIGTVLHSVQYIIYILLLRLLWIEKREQEKDSYHKLVLTLGELKWYQNLKYLKLLFMGSEKGELYDFTINHESSNPPTAL